MKGEISHSPETHNWSFTTGCSLVSKLGYPFLWWWIGILPSAGNTVIIFQDPRVIYVLIIMKNYYILV